MRRIIKAVIFISMAVAAASCEKDETLYYNNMTMGNIVDGRFVSDQGNTFNIVEQLKSCKERIDTMSRAIIICDVLKETKGASKEYDIRLNDAASVLTKAPVKQGEATENMTEDPIRILQLWFSGGYMNMLIEFPSRNKETEHTFDLIYSIGKDDEYIFRLVHDANGDIWDGNSAMHLDLTRRYISFPISSIITDDAAQMIIKHRWFRTAGDAWSSEIEDYLIGHTWERDPFEQVPLSES